MRTVRTVGTLQIKSIDWLKRGGEVMGGQAVTVHYLKWTAARQLRAVVPVGSRSAADARLPGSG